MNVVLSTTGMSHLPNSIPMSRSIHGNALSWPMARITVSHGMISRPIVSCLSLPSTSVDAELLELHPGQLAVLDDEAHRLQVLEDLDLLFLGVLELPGRRLEVLARLAGDDLHVGGAEALGRAAAVHRRVADADDQHALADRVDVAEVDRLEPLDADEHLVAVVAARESRAPCPWARRCRRTPRRTRRCRAAPSGSRPACCSGRPRPCRRCSRSLRRAPRSGRRNAGMLMRISPPGCDSFSKIVTS